MNYDIYNEIDYFTNLSDNIDDYNTLNNFNNTSNYNLNKSDNLTNTNNINIQANSSLFSPYEGYIKGNLFKNLYDSYKNLKPFAIKINNEQQEMLINVNQLSFARHELNLLLDNYPNNNNALNLFNRYLKMEKDAINNYERRYGPLEINSEYNEKTPFDWVKDKWPWEV